MSSASQDHLGKSQVQYPVNVLLFSDYYPPVDGGTARHVFLLAHALKERGHDVVVLTSARQRGTGEEITEEGVKVIRYEGIFQRMSFLFRNATLKHNPPIQDPMIARKLEKLIVEKSPEIIHSHGWILYSGLFSAKKFNVPIVSTLHDFNLICPKKVLANECGICDQAFSNRCILCGKSSYGNRTGVIKSAFAYLGVRLNRTSIRKVNKFIAVSSFVKRLYLKHLPLNPDDIVVLPNFVELPNSIRKSDHDVVKKSASDGELPDDFILFVGALGHHKGVGILIDAFRQVNTRTKLVLVGNPEPGHNYRSFENVLFFKNVPREFVEEALSKCRFLVVPSTVPETFSIVALEAMSYGKAVIATDLGGITEFVRHKQTGYLVPPGDSKALADAISYMLENSVSERLGEKGYDEYKSHFSKEKVLPSVEAFYTGVVTDQNRSRD